MVHCQHCNSYNAIRYGIRGDGAIQRVFCNDCNRESSMLVEDLEAGATVESSMPKVLVLDIETLPMEAFVWTLRKPWINTGNLIADWCIVSWAAKWLCDSEVMGDVLTPGEAKRRDDRRIMKSIWQLLDAADFVITHNGERFDLRKLNSRFLYHRMIPTSPYQSIDTLKAAWKQFDFTSNKQGFLNEMLCLPNKLDTDFTLWRDCVDGNPDALARMLDYNKHDVTGLEELYFVFRPWMRSHPNLSVFTNSDKEQCGHCLCEDVEIRGSYGTPANRYHAFRCKECGAPGRSRKSALSPEHRTIRK